MLMPLLRRPPLASVLLLTALLVGVVLTILPTVVSAQPPPPHLFAGEVDDVTINGEAWDGSLIEVINNNGDRVATVDRSGDSWSAFVPPNAGTVRFRLNDATSRSFVVSPGNLTQIALLLVDGGPGRTVALVTGFNFVVWTGLTMSVDDALGSFPDVSRIDAIFAFDSATQIWESFRPGQPAFLQSIDELVSGGGYFFSMTGSATWQMPVDGALGGTETIATGFTAVGWVGADGVPQDVLDAVADAGSVVVLFRFNAGTQGYDSYRPGSAAFLQSIDDISQYDVFFILATAPTSITQ